MRLLLVLMLVMVTACTPVGSSDTTSAPVTATTTVDSSQSGIPVLLASHEVTAVTVGDRTMRLAIADSPGLRATGLMGVTDLGALDGMLFYWRHEASGGFWMKDTVIPLDIVWFDVEGHYVGRASMVPCAAEPCEVYSPGSDVDYRFAIEADPGDLDWVTGSTAIVYSD